MNSSNIFRTAVTFAAGLVVIAFAYFALIRPFWEGSRGGAVVMRSYFVAGDYAEEVREALQDSLRVIENDDKSVLGRVTVAPNGQLIVTAPESIHRGVENLLNDVLAHSPGKTPTVKLETWLVTSTTDLTEQSAGVHEVVGIKEIEPALKAISDAQGRQHFTLLEKLTLHTHAGQGGAMKGLYAMMSAKPTVRRSKESKGVVAVELSLHTLAERGNLNTVVELNPGELIVLGQASYRSADSGKGGSEILYYIVRATL